ncbi:MAG TPA: glycosyltransferase family 4 protein [Acidothermaceae bacterium]|nr:glycosyltransferase family 4 protein [Acidothermaceae bacterium]
MEVARRRVAVVTTEPLSAELAGPAIRAVELGRVLATEHDVEVASTASCSGAGPDGNWQLADNDGLHALAARCDVMVLGGDVLAANQWLAEAGPALAVDLYDPFHLEQLEQARDLGEAERRRVVFGTIDVLNIQAVLGDTFLCASGRQRDMWLGHLAACGRVNPVTYDADPTLRSLLRVVPFGVADSPPASGAPALRGVVRGIGVDDEILLWGGGIYNWFDPNTLIRAVDKLRASRPKLRLVFMGVQHPNPVVKTMRAAVEAWELSNELELTDVHVFFSDSFSSGWIPYAERGRYLADATIGVSTHHDHVETAFSFRTRILDYFWAGLPVVTTRGDALAEVIERAGAGRTVDPGDVDGLASAINELLDDEAARTTAAAASARLADQYRWSSVAQPLLDFCRNPYRAPDLADPATRAEILARARLAPTRSLTTRIASRLRK